MIHLPAPSLGATSCPSRLYILLCGTMTGDYSPSPFVPFSGPARPLVSSPRFSYVIHGLAPANTAPPIERARAHAFALLLVYSNSQFRQRLLESRLKVTQALYGSSLHLGSFDCDFPRLSCGFRRRGKARTARVVGGDAREAAGTAEGYPDEAS